MNMKIYVSLRLCLHQSRLHHLMRSLWALHMQTCLLLFSPIVEFCSFEAERKKDKTNASMSKLENSPLSDLWGRCLSMWNVSAHSGIKYIVLKPLSQLKQYKEEEGHLRNKCVAFIRVWWVTRRRAATRPANTISNWTAQQTLLLAVCLDTIRDSDLNVNGPKWSLMPQRDSH